VWCWLVSTVLWLVLVERQLDLLSVTVRLRDWAQSAHRFSACERDKGMRRILNVTALVVAFMLPLFGSLRLHGCHVSCTGAVASSAQPGELAAGSLGRFGLLGSCLAHSRRKDVTWSGGDAVPWMVFTFFAKVRLWVTSDQDKLPFTFGYPRFCVSQARVIVVLGICPGTCVVPSRSVSSVLDTLTPVFELYVRLRERRQRPATCVCGCAVARSAFVVGGVVLVGLHCSLACACGAAVGPFVRDYETER
ncbi:hypothetical protein Taro_007207, partial [Colocasia esculenta]|nr:hypothetical protein [Colocasia esculenta]